MELRLESFSLYHPDTLAPYLQAKLAKLVVEVTPPTYHTMMIGAASKVTTKVTKTIPIKRFANTQTERSYNAMQEDSLSNSVIIKQLAESNLRPYVLNSINEGRLKDFYSKAVFKTCGVLKALIYGESSCAVLLVVCFSTTFCFFALFMLREALKMVL